MPVPQPAQPTSSESVLPHRTPKLHWVSSFKKVCSWKRPSQFPPKKFCVCCFHWTALSLDTLWLAFSGYPGLSPNLNLGRPSLLTQSKAAHLPIPGYLYHTTILLHFYIALSTILNHVASVFACLLPVPSTPLQNKSLMNRACHIDSSICGMHLILKANSKTSYMSCQLKEF